MLGSGGAKLGRGKKSGAPAPAGALGPTLAAHFAFEATRRARRTNETRAFFAITHGME